MPLGNSGRIKLAMVIALAAAGLAILLTVRLPQAQVSSWSHSRAAYLTAAQRAARSEYFARRLGLQFGVPRGARTRAIDQMKRSGAAIQSGMIGVSPSANSFGWSFIGPQPMQNALPNFGGPISGTTFDATGRMSAIAADPTTPGRLFVGAAGGGVWMSTDSGTSFVSIFDQEPTQAIGAVALDTGTSPPTIYVATGEGNGLFGGDPYYGQGIFKSTNLGASWSVLASGTFDHDSFTRLAVIPSHGGAAATLFAAVTGGNSASRSDANVPESDPTRFGLWRSTDAGNTWSQFPASTFGCAFDNAGTEPCPATDVVVDPTDPSRVYTAIEFDNVFVSTNGGSTWTKANLPGIPQGLNNLDRVSLATGPAVSGAPHDCSGATAACGVAYAMVGALDAGEYVGFFKSSDGGATWSAQSVPSFFNPDGLTIDGTSSSNFSQEDYDQALLVSPTNPASLTFGGVGLYQSTDSGATWSFLASNGGTHSDQHALAIAPDNDTVYVGNDGGLFKFALSGINGGVASFTSLNAGLPVGQIQAVGPHPTDNSDLLAGFQDNGTDLFTGSLPWNQTDTGDGGFVFFDHPNPSLAFHTYASTGTSAEFANSSDGGSTWNFASFDLGANFGDPGPEFYPPFVGDPSVAKRVLLGAHSVYVLNFATNSIVQQTNQDLTGGCSNTTCALEDIEFVPPGNNKAWAVAMQSGSFGFTVFNTTQADCPDQPSCSAGTNTPGTWNNVTGNLPFASTATQATGIAVDPTDSSGQTAYLSISGFSATTGVGHIFKTADFGGTWTEVDGQGGASPLPDIPILRVLVDRTDLTGKTILAASDIGMFRSADGGLTWASFNLGTIPAVPVFDVEQNDNGTIFAGTHGRGAYQLMGTAGPTPTATPTPSPVSALLTFRPHSARFPKEVFLDSGATSPAKLITIVNPVNRRQNTPVTIEDIEIQGEADDFSGSTNCPFSPQTLAPGQSCSIEIDFSPTALGARNALITVTDNGLNNPAIPVFGVGVQGLLIYMPHALNFGKVTVGSSSVTKTVTLINRNPVGMTLRDITLTGDFNGSTNCATTLAGNSSCAVALSFVPTVAGRQTGSLVFTDNAARSPQSVRLVGVGQ